jgi:hypothetical protein
MEFTAEFDEEEFGDVVSESWDEDTAAFVDGLRQRSQDIYRELLSAISMVPFILSTKNRRATPAHRRNQIVTSTIRRNGRSSPSSAKRAETHDGCS